MLKLFYIGTGGFLGASCRYLLTKWVGTKWESIFPNGTLAVNVIGSFFLGFLMIFFLEKTTNYSGIKVFVTTGFLGAFTTFSTFSFETIMLLENRRYLIFIFNIFGNLLFCLLAVMLGIFLARTL